MPSLTNVGASYDAITASKDLGIALFDFTGASQVTFTVYANKIGTGTQSWQLWSVTDAAEITVIADAGASGDKVLTTTVAVALTGVKVVRVRAKSTLATDDPWFYGAAVMLVVP
jgi:hypothetical protein